MQARGRIAPQAEFARFWDIVLSDEQRQELGDDVDTCFERHPFSAIHLAKLKNCSTERAIVEIAYRLQHLSLVDYERLVKDALDGANEPTQKEGSFLPKWDRHTGKLRYRGKLCRTIKVAKATAIVPILDAFEKAGWPEFLEHLVDTGEDPQRVHQVVRNLKTDLAHISFAVQGDSISWSPTAS